MYFWGPKAVHFFHASAIDIEFLKFPHYYLMHPDYPPLVPLAWAASSMIAGKFSYWGAVLTTPVLLVAAALTFRGFAVSRLGARKSAAFATLLLGVLTTATIAGSAAGGGTWTGSGLRAQAARPRQAHTTRAAGRTAWFYHSPAGEPSAEHASERARAEQLERGVSVVVRPGDGGHRMHGREHLQLDALVGVQ